MVYMSGCICIDTFPAACLSISIVNVSCHISTLRPSESFGVASATSFLFIFSLDFPPSLSPGCILSC